MKSMFSRIYGMEATAVIANSMGDISEGLSYQDIEARFGFHNKLLPQDIKGGSSQPDWGPPWVRHAHHRPPGATEDGMERHRLLTTAVIEKKGRITVEDLARVWVRDIDPKKFGYYLGPQDQVIYWQLWGGVPPWEVGRHAAWPGMIGTSKMILPIACVNACNPRQAALDAMDVARIKDVRGVNGNYAVEVAAAIAAGAAEALRPMATVDGVIDTALAQLSKAPRREVEMGLGWAKEVDDWKALRPKYADHYRGRPISNAVEILSSALAVFKKAQGDLVNCILWSVNFGRDCDCRAYVAGGLAAAMHGIDALPQEWVDTVEEATANDKYTVSTRTPHEAAQGIYEALQAEIAKQKQVLSQIEPQVSQSEAAAI